MSDARNETEAAIRAALTIALNALHHDDFEATLDELAKDIDTILAAHRAAAN